MEPNFVSVKKDSVFLAGIKIGETLVWQGKLGYSSPQEAVINSELYYKQEMSQLLCRLVLV